MNHANHVNHVNHRPLFFSQPACNHVNYCDHNLKKNAGTVIGRAISRAEKEKTTNIMEKEKVMTDKQTDRQHFLL